MVLLALHRQSELYEGMVIKISLRETSPQYQYPSLHVQTIICPGRPCSPLCICKANRPILLLSSHLHGCNALRRFKCQNCGINGHLLNLCFVYNGHRFCQIQLEHHRSSHFRNIKFLCIENPTRLFFIVYSVYAMFMAELLCPLLTIKPGFSFILAFPVL